MKKHTHQRKVPLRLLAGSGLLFSLLVPGYSQGAPGGAAKPSTVLVEKATAIDSAVNKKYIGQVEAIDRVTVQPRVSGNIVATRFREGKVVKKGDLLFEIEDTRYKAAVEEAVAKKAQLEAKLLYAKNSFERYNRLLASKSVSMDTVENAKSTMHALEAEIQSADAAITVAKDDLNYTKLTAPITGRTGRVTFSTGNYITPTSGSLVTITGIDEVYVKFPISERDFLSLFGTQEKMKKDALVSVNLANGKAYDQPGKIFMTDNTVQPTTDTPERLGQVPQSGRRTDARRRGHGESFQEERGPLPGGQYFLRDARRLQELRLRGERPGRGGAPRRHAGQHGQ